jgi:hypothetical protein
MVGHRSGFVHQTMIRASSSFDERAPGGAVTVALCGTLDHDGPCPLAPHHTSTSGIDDLIAVRVVFATEPEREGVVRRCVDTALSAESFRSPDGALSTWTVIESYATSLNTDEYALADRLCNTL